MTKRILGFIAAAFLALPGMSLAADGDVVTQSRSFSQRGWGVQRYLICDADTTTVTCSTLTPPGTTVRGTTYGHPYDFYRVWVDESDACTSWTIAIRDYPVNTAADCNGSCDAHTLVTLTSTGTSNQFMADPLGEAMDANITAISSCTVSVYVDFYTRDQTK